MSKRDRRTSACFSNLLAVFFLCTLPAVLQGADESPPAKGPEGIWQGTLKIQGVLERRLLFKIENAQDGSLKAALDSIDQGAKDIAVDEVRFDDGELTLTIKKIGASFTGKMNEEAAEVVGKFKQGGQTFPLTLKRTERGPALARPQEPKRPLPYVEEEVTYENSAAGIKLAGTLTLPRAKGRVPAVVLITGSGAQARDESLMGHKPFLVLADHLTRRGIAVLRVDDRGVGGSTAATSEGTTEDFVGDVLEGVKFLMRRPEVDPRRIGLIGHSEGGLIAPLAAVRSTDVSFIVLMAGTGVPGDEIIYRQGELIARATGESDPAIAANRKIQEQAFAVVKAEPDPTKAKAGLREVIAEALAASDVKDDAGREALKATLEAQARRVSSPWFRYFLCYDPRPALAKVTCPVLALNGEKDLQVDPRQNLPEIAKALKAGGNRQFAVKEFPGLNHLFQTCQTGSPAEYGKIAETIAPVVLATIAAWIIERIIPTSAAIEPRD